MYFLFALSIAFFLYLKVLKKKTGGITEEVYSYFLLLNTSFNTFFFERANNSFLWPHILDQTITHKLSNPEILKNDFIIMGLLKTPKIIFCYSIYFLQALGIKPQMAFQFLDAVGQIIGISIFYLTLCKIIKKISKVNRDTYSFIIFIVFTIILCEYYTSFLINLFSFKYFTSFFSFKHISYSTNFALFLGLIAILNHERKKTSLTLYFFTVLFNPLIGFFIFCIWFIYIFLSKRNYRDLIIKFSILLAIGATYKLYFSSPNILSTEEFIKLYIYEHQPTHYVISHGFNKKFLFLLFILFIPSVLSKNNKQRTIYFFSFLFILIPITLQYVFIEIIPLRVFGTLTFNRTVIFTLFIILINYSSLLASFIDQRTTKSFFIQKNDMAERFRKRLIITRITAIVAVLVSAFFLAALRYHKLPKSHIADHEKVIEWFEKNTRKTDVLQVFPHPDLRLNFYFRLFINRPVYFGYEFPLFNDQAIKTWEIRKNKIQSIDKSKSLSELKNKVNFIIINSNTSNYEGIKKIKSFDSFSVFEFEK